MQLSLGITRSAQHLAIRTKNSTKKIKQNRSCGPQGYPQTVVTQAIPSLNRPQAPDGQQSLIWWVLWKLQSREPSRSLSEAKHNLSASQKLRSVTEKFLGKGSVDSNVNWAQEEIPHCESEAARTTGSICLDIWNYLTLSNAIMVFYSV